jgi:hypothetical protein
MKERVYNSGMRPRSPFEADALQKQMDLQRRHGWDLDRDIDWSRGVDLSKPFMPLDVNNICFPGLSTEQRRVFSQFLGLAINETILEMEEALPKLRYAAWEKLLNACPANPELRELGELFFIEEEKHSRAFKRYRELFCQETGIDSQQLKSILPSGFGSQFMRLMKKNAEAGGTALWWVVAAVEEISVKTYKAMIPNKELLDPLFVELHRRHAEEETRHENYAFLMIQLASKRQKGIWGRFQGKTETLMAELVAGPWVLGELTKIFRVSDLDHEFFRTLNTCLPKIKDMKPHELLKVFLFQAPYISWLINPAFRSKHREVLSQSGALSWPIAQRNVDLKKLSVG